MKLHKHFWCGFGCIELDKTDSIASILMTFSTLHGSNDIVKTKN